MSMMKLSAQVIIGTLIAVLLTGVLTGQVKSDKPVKTVQFQAESRTQLRLPSSR